MPNSGAGRPAANAKVEEFCRFSRLLYEKGLVAGVGGNMAARVDDGVLLTPAGYSLRDVEPGLVAKVDRTGNIMADNNPTSDMRMHLLILAARPEINVVCHVHGAYLIAASSMLQTGPDSLPALTPGFACYAHPLPMLRFLAPGSEELAEEAADAFAESRCRALLLRNHGLVAVGRDFREAFNITEETNEAAKIFILSGGRAEAIPAADLEKIDRF